MVGGKQAWQSERKTGFASAWRIHLDNRIFGFGINGLGEIVAAREEGSCVAVIAHAQNGHIKCGDAGNLGIEIKRHKLRNSRLVAPEIIAHQARIGTRVVFWHLALINQGDGYF